MSAATVSCRRTFKSQLVAFTLNILPHTHALVVGGLVKGNAGLLLVGQQDAAAGVDHAAVALGQVLGNVGCLAALCAVAGDQEEGVLVGCADGGGFLGMARPMLE